MTGGGTGVRTGLKDAMNHMTCLSSSTLRLLFSPFQLCDFQLKMFDFLLQLGLLLQDAALDHYTSRVGQSSMKVYTLQD